MTATTVLVVGSSGMLGHKLVQVLSEWTPHRFDVHGIQRRPADPRFRPPAASLHPGADAAGDIAWLHDLLRELRPRVVINCLGVVKQRGGSVDLREMYAVNTVFPQLLADACSAQDARLIHISTDCVFDGSRGSYSESDLPDALDHYGRSKALGEVTYGGHLTLRTSIVGFDIHPGGGLLSWLLQPHRGGSVPGYTEAWFSGFPTVSLSHLIGALVVDWPGLSGLYHVAAPAISKFDLLSRVVGALRLDLRVIPNDDVRIDRTLDDARFRTETGMARPSWDSLVEELVRDWERWPYDRGYSSSHEYGATS